MHIDFPQPPSAPAATAPRPRSPAAVLPLRPLRLPAVPTDATTFGARLVETLLRSVTGRAAPPAGLQLSVQWLAATEPYAPGTPPPAAASTPGETLMLLAQLPVLTADGRVMAANLKLALLPRLRMEFPDLAARLEAALAPGSLPALKAETTIELLRGQELQFQWTDPRALWPLQTLAMRGLLRFGSAAAARDRRRAPPPRPEAPPEPVPAPAVAPVIDDGGPPRISTGSWLWRSVVTFLRWLRQGWG